MWKRISSPWLFLQLLLSVALVVIPVVTSNLGTKSLIITIPICITVLAITITRENLQGKRQQKANVVRDVTILISDLQVLVRGGGGGTHWAILQDLRGNVQFQTQMEKSGNQQAGRLLDERCQRLFGDIGNLVLEARSLNSGSSDNQMKEVIVTFGRLLIEYRTVVEELLHFLKDTKGEKETVQEKVPFSIRIHRELADGYDRLMDSIKQQRDELRKYVGSDWLPDYHLARFPRAALAA